MENVNNLELWEKVEKTNPADTKEITFGRKITAIDPYKQIKAATKEFGAVGKGWGWSVERVEYLPTNELALLIRLWHGEKNNSFDHWGQSSLFIDKAEKKKDTACFKKATTDGVTKCLSLLGFNADVFLGKFDDNKYVQQMKEEFAEKNKKPLENDRFTKLLTLKLEVLKSQKDAFAFTTDQKTVLDDKIKELENKA